MEKAFTLIELLVVIAIISILAAIAIPQFNEYRQKSFDSSAVSDLREVASAEEAYFADTEQYLSCTMTSGLGTCQTLPGLGQMTRKVNLTMTNVSNASFTGTATHPQGTGVVYSWNSMNGGLE